MRRRGSDALKAVAGLVVLGGAAVVASRGTPDWEASLFDVLHDVPRVVDFVLWLPMQAGSAWAPLLAGVVAWRVARSWRPTVGALVTGWGGWWLAKGVKGVIERGRPSAELTDLAVRSSAVTEGLGFVSGHATVAFACAATLSPYLPRRWRLAVYGLAAAVGVSRVVVGAHLPVDVMGGAALGLTLAYAWHFVVGVETAPPT